MSWSRPPTGFRSDIEAELNKQSRAIGLQMLTGVVERSPVDEGRFRSNNLLSVDSADLSTNNDDNSEPKGARVGQGYTEGLAKLAQARNPYQIIYIQNNLPYAERLENGYSDQATAGVYQATFDAILAGLGQ